MSESRNGEDQMSASTGDMDDNSGSGGKDDGATKMPVGEVTVGAVPSDDFDENDSIDNDDGHPSMTVSLFVYWILPILFLTIFGRRGVDTSIPRIPIEKANSKNGPGQSVQFSTSKLMKASEDYERKKREFEQKYYGEHSVEDRQSGKAQKQQREQQAPIASTQSSNADSKPSVDTSTWSPSYQTIVNEIQNRRRRWQHSPFNVNNNEKAATISPSPMPVEKSSRSQKDSAASSSKAPQPSPSSRENDPKRNAAKKGIEELRRLYERDKSQILHAIQFAEALRMWGQTYFDGGTHDQEAIGVFLEVIDQLQQTRQEALRDGRPTDVTASNMKGNVPNEVKLPLEEKSVDGLLCAVYTSLGKLYFMANMFERSNQAYSSCLEIEPHYLDSLHARGSTRIVLNQYEEASQDFGTVIVKDQEHLFSDAYTGMIRILEANESAVPYGWDFVVNRLDSIVPQFEAAIASQSDERAIAQLANSLRRFHHGLFVYNERKTKDYDTAWDHLTKAHEYKLMTLPGYPTGSESAKLNQIRMVFKEGFWPDGMGSSTHVPIFVVGFARSGSTLLERVLDAHSQIYGMGENSVFNGRLESIRQRIVEASVVGDMHKLPAMTREMAEDVVAEMKIRWENRDTGGSAPDNEPVPARFVDKMLTNYFNVGFIHMLYPKALILHVIREPLDTVFSAYKHDFPADRLAYTCDAKVLAELYNTYRDTMEHWEEVLPGRIMHVRYEDLVKDLQGISQSLIKASGLPWQPSVLDFDKKKQYVNTFSTTQVRKKVYTDSIQSWKHYEAHLQPIKDLLGHRVKYDQQTTLPGYQKPPDTHEEQHDEL